MPDSLLLLETGDYILQENGVDRLIIDEAITGVGTEISLGNMTAVTEKNLGNMVVKLVG